MSNRAVAIIGAGQLGSRHLQGVLKSKLLFDVYVVDPNEQSRNVAKSRADEIQHNHELIFDGSMDCLPNNLDLVIIATNSDIRYSVLEALLTQSKVDVLILEKVLFQKDEMYHKALDLINTHQVKAYVNHARRMQSFYQDLNLKLSGAAQNRVHFSAYGVNWGLGCNGLHLSDLLCYLLNDNILKYNSESLDSIIQGSKRQGYAEFTGTLKGTTENGVSFEISSMLAEANETLPISITLLTPSIRVIIQEGAETCIAIVSQENNFELESQKFRMKYQSELSEDLVESALSSQKLSLTSYKDAMANHLLFTKTIREFYIQQTNTKTDRCPIT